MKQNFMSTKTMTIAALATLTLSLNSVTVSAAKSPSKPIVSANQAAMTDHPMSAGVIAGFEELIAKQGQLPKAIAYLKVHIKEVTKWQATIMVLHLENAVKKQLPILGKRLKEARDSDYKLETAEGFYFPVVDYSKFKPYGAQVNADIKAYIDIMAVESDQANLKDAAIVIGYQQLVNRAISQESFLSKYPKSNRAAQIGSLFKSYKTLTFYGEKFRKTNVPIN